MKILGVNEGGYGREKTYIVEISVAELRKVANKAGYRDGNEIEKLEAGQEHPIAEGYDFLRDIVNAAARMESAYADFVKAVPTMQRFVGLIAQQRDSSLEAPGSGQNNQATE